jgi:hypothetical protein
VPSRIDPSATHLHSVLSSGITRAMICLATQDPFRFRWSAKLAGRFHFLTHLALVSNELGQRDTPLAQGSYGSVTDGGITGGFGFAFRLTDAGFGDFLTLSTSSRIELVTS